jgi:hypothetical protein
MDLLNKANLRINPAKCDLGKQELVILGYHISEVGIKLAREKLDKIEAWKTPKSGKNIMRILGLFNFLGT